MALSLKLTSRYPYIETALYNTEEPLTSIFLFSSYKKFFRNLGYNKISLIYNFSDE